MLDDCDPRREEDEDGFFPIPNESSLSDDLDLDLDFPNLNFFIFLLVVLPVCLYIWLICLFGEKVVAPLCFWR